MLMVCESQVTPMVLLITLDASVGAWWRGRNVRSESRWTRSGVWAATRSVRKAQTGWVPDQPAVDGHVLSVWMVASIRPIGPSNECQEGPTHKPTQLPKFDPLTTRGGRKNTFSAARGGVRYSPPRRYRFLAAAACFASAITTSTTSPSWADA